MRRKIGFIGNFVAMAFLLFLLVITSMLVLGVADPQADVVILYDAFAGELPEGIAIDKRGNLYISLNPLGQLWKYGPQVPIQFCCLPSMGWRSD